MTDRLSVLARQSPAPPPEAFAAARRRLDQGLGGHGYCGCTDADPCEPLVVLALVYAVAQEVVLDTATRMVEMS